MSTDKRMKRQLFINVVLMLFTLLTLVSCVVAWFSSSKTASVDGINMMVERSEIVLVSEITTIEFPCATKIADTETTERFFNSDCAVYKDYVIGGKGQLHVDVTIENGPGMLAYVCEPSVTDFYAAITQDLESKLGTNYSDWTFEKIQTALETINNNRHVGTDENGDTVFRIVYWVEYDEAKDLLNKESYWENDPDDQYIAKITVTQ